MRDVEKVCGRKLGTARELEVGCNVVAHPCCVAAVESGEEALAVSVCAAGGLFLELKSSVIMGW
jgi:hypothetical protein